MSEQSAFGKFLRMRLVTVPKQSRSWRLSDVCIMETGNARSLFC